MQTRPSTVRVRRGYYVRRRTCRCCCVYFVLWFILICSQVNFFPALIWAGLGLLVLELALFR